MAKMIWFDMDGTIADLYAVDGWLPMLRAENPDPYKMARPLVHMATLARLIHKAQRNGYTVGILSWTSKGGSDAYNDMVAKAKVDWLRKHLPSVAFDTIAIVPYGYSKYNFNLGNDILFDDEQRNRDEWDGDAYDVDNLLKNFANVIR